MKKIVLPLFSIISLGSFAQDTLPQFSVVSKGNNRIIVGWYNKYASVKQISVQRSPDSLNNFKTVITVPDPMNRQNGYLDTKAPNNKMFYRLYILLDGGNFIFTKAQRPFSDSVDAQTVTRIIAKKDADSVLTEEEQVILKKYSRTRFDLVDDVSVKEKDASVKKGNKPDLLMPTYRITANQTGLVRIRLNDFDKKQYSVKFFEDDNTFLFELKEIREPLFMLDKSNFHHSGWFKFELYDNGKLVEKNRFFIPKDF
jgi:hypothetical protein